ncbi:neutral/alkaline non-lysosomal ceramidase N-terminal domain-containing protein [Enterocloster asparagiformis]|uniref:neutral/alkaline non-lysosomal ceramidase N-terminal domain-containing protein n=1 Tax=Enterocloster asparagiformis TaxID=333367 RepID=UPI000465D966|nr:neutral/alkaline non-lysosomal ceramidase N-terminal domain-containing protein [Enterocloster asparagiformis]
MVEVSAAKYDITPEFPMYMRGYAMRTGKSIGVLDRLYCRALCLRIDGEIFVWMTLDLCRLEELISDYVRGVVAAKYSVPVEHVILSTIHTHSGPDISFEDEGEDRNRRKADYRSFLVGRVLAAVDECFDRGFLKVTSSVVQGTIEGVYGNRNYRDKPSDKDVNLILFRNENHVVAGIASLTCHHGAGHPQHEDQLRPAGKYWKGVG